MLNIEELKNETRKIEDDLKVLKNNVTLSEEERKNQAEELKNRAETTKKKIENEIHSLADKTDDESKKKKEEAETLLNSFNKRLSLYTTKYMPYLLFMQIIIAIYYHYLLLQAFQCFSGQRYKIGVYL